MSEIAEVPMPEVLDPDRHRSQDRDDMTAWEHRSRAKQLDDALHQSCAYGQDLWRTLCAVREYLMMTIPSDPSTGIVTRTSASPTSFDDLEGWQHWMDVYATVTSAMCGPHGDNGFGRSEAREAWQRRRTRAYTLPAGALDSLPSRAEGEGQRVAEAFVRAESEELGGPVPVPPGAPTEGKSSSGGEGGDDDTARRLRAVRVAAETVLFFLALRGLRKGRLPVDVRVTRRSA